MKYGVEASNKDDAGKPGKHNTYPIFNYKSSFELFLHNIHIFFF